MIKTFEHPDELDIYMNDHKYIIIQVSADWCKPCKSISPIVQQYIEGIKCEDTFLFLKCDYDIISEFGDFLETYQVEKIPYFIFLEYGVMKHSFKGANFEQIHDLISDFVTRNSSNMINDDAFQNDDF